MRETDQTSVCQCHIPDPVMQADRRFYCHKCSFRVPAVLCESCRANIAFATTTVASDCQPGPSGAPEALRAARAAGSGGRGDAPADLNSAQRFIERRLREGVPDLVPVSTWADDLKAIQRILWAEAASIPSSAGATFNDAATYLERQYPDEPMVLEAAAALRAVGGRVPAPLEQLNADEYALLASIMTDVTQEAAEDPERAGEAPILSALTHKLCLLVPPGHEPKFAPAVAGVPPPPKCAPGSHLPNCACYKQPQVAAQSAALIAKLRELPRTKIGLMAVEYVKADELDALLSGAEEQEGTLSTADRAAIRHRV